MKHFQVPRHAVIALSDNRVWAEIVGGFIKLSREYWEDVSFTLLEASNLLDLINKQRLADDLTPAYLQLLPVLPEVLHHEFEGSNYLIVQAQDEADAAIFGQKYLDSRADSATYKYEAGGARLYDGIEHIYRVPYTVSKWDN